MKFLTLATALSILSAVSAKTVYVTQTHITTVIDGAPTPAPAPAPASLVESGSESVSTVYENVNQGKLQQSAAAPAPTTTSQPTFSPTTLVTKTAPSSTAAAPSSTSSSSDDSGIYADIDKSSGIDKDFAKAILDEHNTKRALHSAPPLSWDADLYQYAQNYANQYSCSGSLTHSGGKYGENLAVGYSTGPAAVDAWYDEGNDYSYSAASTLDHFTQVVWKSTTKLGCAYKDCSAENWGKYVICSYDPAGNFVGENKLNVLPN